MKWPFVFRETYDEAVHRHTMAAHDLLQTRAFLNTADAEIRKRDSRSLVEEMNLIIRKHGPDAVGKELRRWRYENRKELKAAALEND